MTTLCPERNIVAFVFFGLERDFTSAFCDDRLVIIDSAHRSIV